MNNEGPVIIITGASRGLGAAAARMGAHLGARVVLAARSLDRLEEQAAAIQAAGGTALAVQADLTREADCHAVISRSLTHFGRIDALVNNSGTLDPVGRVAEANPEAWRENWALNLLAPVLLVKLAMPSLRERAGRIINVSSGAADNAIGGWGAYSSAKAALNHLTRVLAVEEPEITAIALRPGLVDTEMQARIRAHGQGHMTQRNYEWLARLHKQGRLLPPETPGKAVACLAYEALHSWSGEMMQWDDARIQELVQRHWPE